MERPVGTDDRYVQELLSHVDDAFASTSEGKSSASDEKLLALLKQLILEHPEGFFLMHGETLAYGHRKLEYFMRSGRQEDLPRFQAELTEPEVKRLHRIQRRVANSLFKEGH
jgi:hypothetical protein